MLELAQLREDRLQVEPAMRRRIRPESADRLRQLPFAADAPAAPRLVPRDRHVDETLEEIALFARRDAPGVLELLVRGEVLAAADQLDASLKP